MIGVTKLKYAMPSAVSEPQTDDAKMFARFCVSTAEPDRENDVVDQSGIDWTAHKSNPVVLLNHSMSDLPIGLAQDPMGNYTTEPMPASGKTYSTCWFHRKTLLGEQAYELTKAGVLRGASIAFLVTKAESRGPKGQSGRPPLYIASCAPTEWSVVSVPANAGALRDYGDLIRSQLSRTAVAGSPLHPHLRKSLEPLASNAVVWSRGFDPSEPRDADGKWTNSGAAGVAVSQPSTSAAAPPQPHGHLEWAKLAKTKPESEWSDIADRIIANSSDPKFKDQVEWQATNYQLPGNSGLASRPQALRARAALEEHQKDYIAKKDEENKQRKERADMESRHGVPRSSLDAPLHGASAGHMVSPDWEKEGWKEAWKLGTSQSKGSKSMPGQSIQSVVIKADSFPTLDDARAWFATQGYDLPPDPAATTDTGTRFDFFPASDVEEGSAFEAALADKALATFAVNKSAAASRNAAALTINETRSAHGLEPFPRDELSVHKTVESAQAAAKSGDIIHADASGISIKGSGSDEVSAPQLVQACKSCMKDAHDFLHEHSANDKLSKTEQAACRMHRDSLMKCYKDMGGVSDDALGSAMTKEKQVAPEPIVDHDDGDADDTVDEPIIAGADQKKLSDIADLSQQTSLRLIGIAARLRRQTA